MENPWVGEPAPTASVRSRLPAICGLGALLTVGAAVGLDWTCAGIVNQPAMKADVVVFIRHGRSPKAGARPCHGRVNLLELITLESAPPLDSLPEREGLLLL